MVKKIKEVPADGFVRAKWVKLPINPEKQGEFEVRFIGEQTVRKLTFTKGTWYFKHRVTGKMVQSAFGMPGDSWRGLAEDPKKTEKILKSIAENHGADAATDAAKHIEAVTTSAVVVPAPKGRVRLVEASTPGAKTVHSLPAAGGIDHTPRGLCGSGDDGSNDS